MIFTPKLIGIAVLSAVVLSTGVYIKVLRSSIENLKQEKIALQVRTESLENTISELSTSKEELDKKVQLAIESTKAIQAKLVKRKTEIRYVKIPTECPAAVDWLLDEISK